MQNSENTTLGTVETMKRVAVWLDEKKGRDVVALDVAGLCSITEGLVVVTAGSVKHAQALADHVLDRSGEEGVEYLGMEGYKTGGWILVDLNDVLVHIFQDDTRGFYNLEGLWAEAEKVELDLPEADA
ncbi:ribosome silencing factor [Desulfobaculum senezii]|jgi:ribosome-associated protein|uniref:ribosome silencing factor n=1 Tax=Desulfobaculum sp. SPO524 TaxID=3378071 RepID=UPI00385479C4